MSNNLIPEKRMDVNGKTTTRWVLSGPSNKAAPRGIPAPKSTLSKERAMRSRMVLFPETQTNDDHPDEEYAVTIHGMQTFYSPAYAQAMMERMPAKTLALLEETLETLPEGQAKEVVAQTVYDLIREMDVMGGTAASPLVMKEKSRGVSNACAFAEMTDVISRLTDEHSVSNHLFLIDQSTQAYEGNGFVKGSPYPTKVDYGSLSVAKREQAQNYVMADQLHRHFGDSIERLPEGAADLVGDYRGDWVRLATVVKDRGFSDLDSIRVVMDNEVIALSEGSL